MDFKEALSQALSERRMNTNRLASTLTVNGNDVGKQTVDGWVKGIHEPSVSMGIAVAAVLGFSLDALKDA